jgi:hypothetical protein
MQEPKPPVRFSDAENQVLGDFHPQKERLKLAYWILAALFVLYLVSIVSYSWGCSTAGDKIFEAAQKILPPIATLVIGYYFARKNK